MYVSGRLFYGKPLAVYPGHTVKTIFAWSWNQTHDLGAWKHNPVSYLYTLPIHFYKLTEAILLEKPESLLASFKPPTMLLLAQIFNPRLDVWEVLIPGQEAVVNSEALFIICWLSCIITVCGVNERVAQYFSVTSLWKRGTMC